MICFEASKCREKQYNYCGNSEYEKCISVTWIIQVYVRKASYPMYQTPEYLLPFKEHPDRHQKKTKNKEPRQYNINKKPQVGAPFIKNCGYDEEKQDQ